MSTDKKLLTQLEICRAYGICDETWRRWRRAGITPEPALNVRGAAKRWRAADVARFFGDESEQTRYFSAHRRLHKVS